MRHHFWPVFLALFLSTQLYALSVNEVVNNAKTIAYQATGQTVALKSFSPQGEVGSVSQARARFSEDMVRVGDSNVRNPFIVSNNCKGYGAGRWLDTKTWIYQFNNTMPAGLTCNFSLVEPLKSVQGKPVKAYRFYKFSTNNISFGYDNTSTQGVRVIDSMPRHYQTISDDQVFLVKLDKSTNTTSLPRNVYCLSSDSPEKLYVKFFTPQQTTQWIAKQDKELIDWWRKPKGEEYYDSNHNAYKQDAVQEWRALQCGRRLSAGQEMRLVWGKQVLSTTGQARSSDQVLAFRVRPEFTASFSCPRQSAKAACVPLTDMELRFSEAISADKLKQIRLVSEGKTWTPKPNSGDDFEDGYTARFAAPFPANASFVLSLPTGINDVYGRILNNSKSFPLTVKTGGYPPLAKFSADFGVVETAVGAVPLTVRNLEPVLAANGALAKLYTLKIADDDTAFITALKNYQANGNYGDLKEAFIANQAGVTSQELPRKLGARDFEVIGIPVTNGLYIHEVQSHYLGEWISQKQQPAYVHTMSLVTNLGLHVQMGKTNTVVWVTDLAKGEPVANATISVWDCLNTKMLWSGQSSAQGLVKINQALFSKQPQNNDGKQKSCQNSSWIIMAKLDNDRSFALSEWTNGIESWRYNLSSVVYDYEEEYDDYYGGSKKTGDYVAHTIFDRSLLRVGETVHMQHLVRYNKLMGLSAPTQGFSVSKVVIQHAGSGEEYSVTTQLSPIGNGESTWTIPQQAKLGEYCVRLKFSDNQSLSAGCFTVSAFKLPVLKADLGVPSQSVADASQKLPLQLQLRYLNGGAYSHAPVIVRGRVSDTWFSVPEFEDYSFYSVPVIEAKKPAQDEEGEQESEQQDLAQQSFILDEAGALTTATMPLPDIKQVRRVELEMEFRDPNGETQTVGATSTLWPAAVLIGSKVKSSWLTKNEPVSIDFISINQQKQLAPNTSIKIVGQMIRYQSHRKRTLGGYYSYDTTKTKEPIAVNCGTQTNEQGRLNCTFNLKDSGELELIAISTDAQGRQAATKTSIWVSGGNSWWFEQGDDDRIDMLADKKNYQVGDTARLQVRMPFQQANALVSVSRDGVIENWVVPLSGQEPVITIPIKPEYAPNVFISAVIVRGRNNEIQPTALVDLGKPAFKMGITELKVGWESYELGVKVQTDKASYHAREQAEVTVQVLPAKNRNALPNNTEVTLAVVDEALLELANNDSWQALPSMMLSRSYGIETATNQLHVVGKRHFGKKALPSGGGGGRGGSTRELFDTLLLWKASTPVDAQGQAHFSVPINDSLTRFKVVAIASSREQFGTGSTSFTNSQELQLLSGLPQVVRDGDNYQAEFTVRNSSPQPQTVQFTAQSNALKANFTQQLTLAANSAQVVNIPVLVPTEQKTLTWNISAVSEQYQDKLKVTQQVLPSIPLQLSSSVLQQISATKPYELSLAPLPKNALAGSKVLVDMQPNLGGSLAYVKDWFAYYPYACLEQKTTAAAGLQDAEVWAIIMADLPTYLDKDGLAKFYPSSGESAGSSFLTAHVLRLAKALNWQIPPDSRNKMLDALQAYAQGQLSQDLYRHWIYDENFDVVQRHLEVASILAQYGRFKPILLDNLRLQPSTWPVHLLIDWLELLKNAHNMPQRDIKLAEAERLLKAHIVQHGGTYAMLTIDKERWWWYDSDETLQARLLLTVLNDKNWQNEVPLLVRGLLRHQQNGHWQGTQSNLWGAFVIKRFNDGAVNIAGQTQVQIGTEQQRFAWPQTPHIAPERVEFNRTQGDINMAWPTQASTFKATHQGEGSPWLRVSTAARIPITQAQNKGYAIQKNTVAIQQKVKGEWHVGDVMRVELSFTSNQDMGWVVVNDPIPAGAVLLGRGLKRDSQLLNAGSNDWWPVYVEYAADAYRAYYQYLPYKAQWKSAYTVRLNQAGTFKLPATRVEAMYASDVYGLSPNEDMVVKP